jgi:hypothetical protein
VGEFREILANCGAAVSIWTTGTTAVQLGASTTTNAGGHFSLTFTFTCPAAGTLMYMTATSARLAPAACDSATICLF